MNPKFWGFPRNHLVGPTCTIEDSARDTREQIFLPVPYQGPDQVQDYQPIPGSTLSHWRQAKHRHTGLRAGMGWEHKYDSWKEAPQSLPP